MTPAQEAERWLIEHGGFHYHCFISWPRTISPNLNNFARKLKIEIEGKLAETFAKPSTFLDEQEITVGDDWIKTLGSSLCRSMTMIALCAPIYYHDEKKWCHREWAAMKALSNCRLAGLDCTAIIPVRVKKHDDAPPAVARLQHIDCSSIVLSQNYKSVEFQRKVSEIADRVVQLAHTLGNKQAKAECEHFEFPDESPFGTAPPAQQAFPLIG